MCCCQVLDGLIEFKIKWGDVFMSGVVGVAGHLFARQGVGLVGISPFAIFRMNHREMLDCASGLDERCSDVDESIETHMTAVVHCPSYLFESGTAP